MEALEYESKLTLPQRYSARVAKLEANYAEIEGKVAEHERKRREINNEILMVGDSCKVADKLEEIDLRERLEKLNKQRKALDDILLFFRERFQNVSDRLATAKAQLAGASNFYFNASTENIKQRKIDAGVMRLEAVQILDKAEKKALDYERTAEQVIAENINPLGQAVTQKEAEGIARHLRAEANSIRVTNQREAATLNDRAARALAHIDRDIEKARTNLKYHGSEAEVSRVDELIENWWAEAENGEIS